MGRDNFFPEVGLKSSSVFTTIVAVASFVIAIISFITASWTFYYTYWYPGEVQIIVADKIGIVYSKDNKNKPVGAFVQITFVNTGSLRMRSQISEITADFSSVGKVDAKAISVHMTSVYEVSFISNQEYIARYHDYVKDYHENDRDFTSQDDQLIYEGRSFPFQITGGMIVSKTFALKETSDTQANNDIQLSNNPTLELQILVNNEPKKLCFALITETSSGQEISKIPIGRYATLKYKRSGSCAP
jgi:hypothetical protein